MNSVNVLKKTVSSDLLLRLSRLRINQHKSCIQNVCSVTGVKIDPENVAENRRSSSTRNSKFSQNFKDPDTFGTLKAPLETGSKFNRNSRTGSMEHDNRKVIKIKRPKRDESDVFGNLSESNPVWYPDMNEEPKVDNDLDDDSVIVKNISKRYRCPQVYLEEMKTLVKQKKVKDALDLFVDMKRNFVSPIPPHYTYMIGVCGRIGYTEMAFKLFRQMTDRAITPTPATLTGLFNACAESPFPEYGLKKAHLLKEKIEIKNWTVTQITYHAMIKAFGKCGDLVTAFKIVDEMAKVGIKIDVNTCSFLLMSCISNKEAGFTYAVEVWRMMKAKKFLPRIFSFNLLLRATRDCDVGPEEISCLLLQHWSSYTKRPYGFITKESLSKKPMLKLSSASNDNAEFLEKENKSHTVEDQNEKIDSSYSTDDTPKYELTTPPNSGMTTNLQTSVTSVLSARPINGPEILEILNIKTSSDRLSLLGGLEGFLELMQKSRVKPDMNTFTLLLECIPDNIQEEEKLLTIIDNYEMKPNIDFFNCLIKKRVFRKEDLAARNVLVLINKYDLAPDIMTFGALSLACRTLKQASTFIIDMEKMGCYPNAEIIGGMVKRACMILDFSYMKYLLELMEEQQIKPNEQILFNLEKCLSKARKHIILMEHGKEVGEFYQRETLPIDFKEFSTFYEAWLKRMKFQNEDHPWLQYKTDIIDRAKAEVI